MSRFISRSLSYFKKIEVIESLLGAISLGIILSALNAKALAPDNSSFEMSCRMKAKEVAAETYRGCVTDNKKAQLDQIKMDYQSRIKALKDEYSEELKKLSNGAENSGPSDENSSPSAGANSTSSAPPTGKRKSAKGRKSDSGKMVAKALPAKKVTTSSDDLSEADMSYSLHPYAQHSSPTAHDESTMDIPEPIPMDNN